MHCRYRARLRKIVGWLQGWFAFWQGQAATNPAFWVCFTGALELSVGLGSLFGFMRRVAYVGGAVLSSLIWAVPEGFGGPYGPGSTDQGAGIVDAMVFLMLIVINSAYGPSRWSLDHILERRWPGWAVLAEFRGGLVQQLPTPAGVQA